MPMNIELILMKCKECGSTEITFDERLGEKCCVECGLVIITGMFEETVNPIERGDNYSLKHSADKGRLGSLVTGKGASKYNRHNPVLPRNVINGITHCNMVMANLRLPINLTERIQKVYLELYNSHTLRNFTLEERATAIVYYLLKENRTPHPLKDVAKEFDVKLNRTKKLIRKINQFYRNSIHYSIDDSSYLIQQTARKITDEPQFVYQCNKVMQKFETLIVNSNFNKSRCYYAAICVLASTIFVRGYSCKFISEQTGFHRTKIGKECKNLLTLLGVESLKDIKGKELNKLGE